MSMTVEQVLKVLAKIALIDSRQVDELIALEWFDIIGDLEFEDAIAAVKRHRQTSTEYLMPAHVMNLVSEIRAGKSRRSRAAIAALEESMPDAVRYGHQPFECDARELQLAARASDAVRYAEELLAIDSRLTAAGLGRLNFVEHIETIARDRDWMGAESDMDDDLAVWAKALRRSLESRKLLAVGDGSKGGTTTAEAGDRGSSVGEIVWH
jgi:hypothetical protein